MKHPKIIIPKKNLNLPIQLIHDLSWWVNIRFPNQELYGNPLVHPDIAMAYTLNFYGTQISSEGFFNAIYNVEKSTQLNDRIKEGILKINAKEQLSIFKKRTELVTALPYESLTAYFNRNTSQGSSYPILEDDISQKVSEQIPLILGNWISKHPDLEVIPDEQYQLLLSN